LNKPHNFDPSLHEEKGKKEEKEMRDFKNILKTKWFINIFVVKTSVFLMIILKI